MLADEDRRIEAGAEPRDLGSYSEWRKETDRCVLKAFEFYGSYLMGQTSGFSDALNLQAVLAACEIEGVEPDDRPELTQRVILIHNGLTEIARHEAEMKKRG